MSLLTPLFVLGALAVGLPLLFHLIQRRPKGQMEFSSLMFLSPSPPRISRRSRLDNLLLLLLRGLALVLLALAFGRPFLRSSHWLDEEPPARRVLVLVDTSASMGRAGLWDEAQQEIRQVVADLRATDEAALYAFDSTVRPLVPFAGASQREEIGHAELFASALKGVTLSHAATDLGQALATAADHLHTSQDSGESSAPIPKQIILVTDLQEGSDIERLRGFAWPEEVQVDIRRVQPDEPTNARAIVAADDAMSPSGEAAAGGQWRVTVYNAGDSTNQQFRLGWANSTGRLVGEREYSVQVPPGGSRVVRLPMPPAGAEQLVVTGDDQPFDNEVFVVRPTLQQKELLYVGSGTRDDTNSLFYYLARADFDDVHRDVTAKSLAANGLPPELVPRETPLTVVAQPIADAEAQILRDYVQEGGKILLVLAEALRDPQAARETVRRLTGDESLETMNLTEADASDYAMLAQIDFSHPIFEPFADPRFSDFTKIRFWSHRRLEVADDGPGRVLARFDDGSAALVEYAAGEGRVWILAAGWQPEESQFALSSKFIPVLAGMLHVGELSALRENYWVGEPVELPADHPFERVVTPAGDVQGIASITTAQAAATVPREGTGEGGIGRDERVVLVFNSPGVYRLHDGDSELPFAVNLAASESRTAPLDVSELEANGVSLGRAATVAQLKSERRRLRDFELERNQKLWQWLLVGVLAVLGAESWLAGRLSKRPLTVAPT
jgi:hypothetical protein